MEQVEDSRLTFLHSIPNRQGKKWALYKCSCGKEKTFIIYAVIKGLSKSCGCLQKEVTSRNRKTHGSSQTPLYKVWKSIIGRIKIPTNTSYSRYGGRGIGISEAWLKFENFESDMGPRPDGRFSVERVDNNGDYCKENCVWATDEEQANNKSNNRILTLNDEKHNVQQWSVLLNINEKVLRRRLRLGWSDERILTTKPRKRGNSL